MNTILMTVANSAAEVITHRAKAPNMAGKTRRKGYRWQQTCSGDEGGGQQQRGERGDGAVQS